MSREKMNLFFYNAIKTRIYRDIKNKMKCTPIQNQKREENKNGIITCSSKKSLRSSH